MQWRMFIPATSWAIICAQWEVMVIDPARYSDRCIATRRYSLN